MPLEIDCWQAAPKTLSLPSGELHLWRLPLDLPETTLAYYYDQLLAIDEQARADRLLVADKRRQFIAARGRLRMVLARYVQLPARQLDFYYSTGGKPFLCDETYDIHFNLSHSAGLALLGVTVSGPVGVDLERLAALADPDKIAAQFFTERERDILSSASPARHQRIFYRLWTRKESCLKYLGEGFSAAGQTDETISHSRCRSLPLGRNYLAATCFDHSIRKIRRYQLRSRHKV